MAEFKYGEITEKIIGAAFVCIIRWDAASWKLFIKGRWLLS